MKITIDKAENGYILKYSPQLKQKMFVFQTLEELFNWQFMHFEGRADCFNGDSYGSVKIEYSKKEEKEGC